MSLIKCERCKKEYSSNRLSSFRQTYNRKLVRHICRRCLKKKQDKYRKTENGRIAEIMSSQRAYIKHKDKWIARAKTRYAIKTGTIKKLKKCEVCEKIKPLEAHHEDYTKPLEVIFLCSGCHADAHRKY